MVQTVKNSRDICYCDLLIKCWKVGTGVCLCFSQPRSGPEAPQRLWSPWGREAAAPQGSGREQARAGGTGAGLCRWGWGEAHRGAGGGRAALGLLRSSRRGAGSPCGPRGLDGPDGPCFPFRTEVPTAQPSVSHPRQRGKPGDCRSQQLCYCCPRLWSVLSYSIYFHLLLFSFNKDVFFLSTFVCKSRNLYVQGKWGIYLTVFSWASKNSEAFFSPSLISMWSL